MSDMCSCSYDGVYLCDTLPRVKCERAMPEEHMSSQDPVDVREAYAQGLRAGVAMFSQAIPALRDRRDPINIALPKLVAVAERKVEEACEAALLP